MTIKADHLTFAYRPRMPGNHPTPVLADCSLAVNTGATLAIMGRSGAGKSTLGYVLSGLAPRHTGGTLSGTLSVAGVDVTEHPPKIGSVGLLFQDPTTQLFSVSAEEEIAWGLEALGVPPQEIGSKVTEALRCFGLAEARRRPPWALSGGQQKRLALAAVWAMRPRILIMDEPLSGLDPQGRAEVSAAVETLREAGTTLITMTLRPEVAKLAQEIHLLAAGKLSPLAGPAGLDRDELARLIEAGIFYPTERWPDLRSGTPAREAEPALEIKGLHFHYPDGTMVLRGIDLVIPTGQFVALMGRNGAGKSTLARHLNGLLRPLSGSVRVLGKAIGDRPTGAISRDVGFLFQRPEQQLFAATVREELTYGPRRLGLSDTEARLRDVLVHFGLQDFADIPPALLDYGTQRAVTLAMLAMLHPPIVVLDEPTVGLDGRGLAQLLGWLAELRDAGTTIVLVTHERHVASAADRVLHLEMGRIIADEFPSRLRPETHRIDEP